MKLMIVVPCYNEEAVLPETTSQLIHVVGALKEKGSIDEGDILYVDDGSKDRTWELIESLSRQNAHVTGIKLAHNVGHQQALWAGLEWASAHADAAISIDADLQDDVEAIYPMVDYFNKGIDVVYGVRKERTTDTFFKKNTALAFYRLMRGLGGDIVYNHADFRLMSRRALQALVSFPERNLFLRGMVSSLGFPSAMVYYDRKERYIAYLGMLFMLIAVLAIVYGICSYVDGQALPGWTSLIVSVWFIGGAILLACGIIGEYVGKIYKEVKRRPRYFVEKSVNLEE